MCSCTFLDGEGRPSFQALQHRSLDGQDYGCCEFDTRLLLVDVLHHASDRELRATVLHEMIHAVLERGGHHAPFWTQLEYLLSRGAPITIARPELGERGWHLHIIPARFRRRRRLFHLVHQRQQREIARETARITNCVVQRVTPHAVEQECEDAAISGASWPAVRAYQSQKWGWIDLDGRVTPRAKTYQVAAWRGYLRGRRFFLEERRIKAGWDSMKATTSGVAVADLGGAMH